jgi:ubiquinone biosynthesis protein
MTPAPEKLFAFFDPEPLGSGSIGQVHAARLFGGRDVVLKVRKPGVDDLVRIDLDILAGLIDEWSPRFPMLTQYDARGLLRDFTDVLLAELDYGREAANVKFFPRPVRQRTRIQDSRSWRMRAHFP